VSASERGDSRALEQEESEFSDLLRNREEGKTLLDNTAQANEAIAEL